MGVDLSGVVPVGRPGSGQVSVAKTAAVRTLRPTTGWVAVDLHELVDFKDLIVEFARRDIKLRYRQTALGIAWVVLQPIVAAGVLNFAFGVVAGARPRGPSYFLFTFAGLLMWNLFSMTLNKTSLSLVGNSYLISKVYFPRLILPISGTLATLLDFAVALGVLFVLQAFYGIVPQWQLVLVPVWIAIVLCLALGAGLIAAALTVQYRDIQHILPILIPFMLYASPVAYDVTQIPEGYQRLFYLINPLAAPIVGFRASLLPAAPMPPLPYLAWSALVAVGMFGLGAAVFKRTERRFADVV
jgi:homopolymeric O-antigen transport system permease protein